VPALSWDQTWSPVLVLGATPVAVDLAPEWPVIDYRKVEQCITTRTKLVISTGLWGNPCGLPEVDHICKRHGIMHLVDGAQLFNARVENKGISHAADLVVLSFNPKKILTVGEGGTILGRSYNKLRDRLLLVTGHPVRIHGEIEDESLIEFMLDGCNLNFKVNPIGALIGLNKIENNSIKISLVENKKKREKIGKILSAFGLNVLEEPESFIGTEPNYTAFLVDSFNLSDTERSEMRNRLFASGFESTPCPYIIFAEVVGKRQGRLFPWDGSRSLIYHESHEKENMPWSDYWTHALEIVRYS